MALIKIYYSKISKFIFIYSIDDESSFTALEEEVALVLRETQREKFVGILIGYKHDQAGERKVPNSAGMSLKDRYNLDLFLELDSQDWHCKNMVFNVIKGRS